MAKANGINKRLLAKKDMNFFAEFTANAAKQARMLGYGVAAGFLVVFVVLTFIIAFFIRNQLIKASINELTDTLNGPEYAGLEQEAALLTEELNERTNYYFALTQMRQQVDMIDPASTNLPDVIAKCIPNDSYISSYQITNSQLTMTGSSFTYYSPVEMVNMLNNNDVFSTRPTINTVRHALTEELNVEDIIAGNKVNVVNNYYDFTISGLLVSTVHVSVTRYLDNSEQVVALGGVETTSHQAGSSYTLDQNFVTYTYGGVNYKLSKIYVNGVQVDSASFTDIVEHNAFTDVARSNADIRLYYVPADAAAEG